MVGYAYSCDPKPGYDYIIIKGYDADDMSFVTSVTPYFVYRVCRSRGTRLLTYESPAYSGKLPSTENIDKITRLVIIEEYDHDHPVSLEWAITPSDICIKRNSRPLGVLYPMPPSLINKESAYINVTHICFGRAPYILEASFLTDVLNETAFHLGIYSSEPFVLCTNEIFCSRYMCLLVKKIFSSDIFGEKSHRFKGEKLPRRLVSKRKILRRISSLEFPDADYNCYDNQKLTVIKRQCIKSFADIISASLHHGYSFVRTSRMLTLAFAEAISEIRAMSVEFLARSGAERSTDVNHITFDRLMMLMTFPISHTETRSTIRTNKERIRRLRELTAPGAVYKGNYERGN